MKRKLFFATIIISSLTTACSKHEKTYSCNPEINDWVRKNKNELASISRDELATLDYEKQRGLFVSFSPEQRVKIYQSKYQYLMNLTTLSETEKEYLTLLYQHLSPNIYSSEKEKMKFSEFTEKWINEVQIDLGWTNFEIYCYTHTWLTNEEIEMLHTSSSHAPSLKTIVIEPPCTCYFDIDCWKGGIPIYPYRDCVASSVCMPVDGCGVLGFRQCDGVCKNRY